MNLRQPLIAIAAVVAMAAPAAIAHRMWMIASSTIVSGDDNWVTVDAAVSNDLFYFDHQPLRATPAITQPDGTAGQAENLSTGKFRTTFDVHLTQQGTYRIAAVNEGVFGSYKLNGETKMIPRGTTRASLAAAIPAGATDVVTAESLTRNEIFVTQGAPTTTVFKPSGRGVEMVPVTHPNDLVTGEPATFQFLLDGKPAPGLFVTVVEGNGRYREVPKQMDLKTDAAGKVTIAWPEAGMYWLNVTPTAPRPEGEGMREGGPRREGAGTPGAEGGPRPMPSGPQPRRVSYVTTLEVMAP